MKIFALIPAWNEEQAIGRVIDEIPRNLVCEVVVVSNGSSDRTEAVASAHGATVLREERRGYGHALMKGIAYVSIKNPDILVFLDGDLSDYPAEIPLLLQPIIEAGQDLVIGSRVRGEKEKGALLPQARFGNWLATSLIKLFWGVRFTDLGPFRAITFAKFNELQMKEMTYGWTVEMQIKAAKKGFKCTEIPVRYRRRIGQSKVTGTIAGSCKAGCGILRTIFLSLFGPG
ncbi:MAG: glycosyltransferase family 2 protein [Chrysiogenales bacterium]|nr:MAG: glycosyltransferase family 2 protein [Chrysiogenales bacterium]